MHVFSNFVEFINTCLLLAVPTSTPPPPIDNSVPNKPTLSLNTTGSTTAQPPTGTMPINTQQACLTARNLTEAWRMDHNGSDIRPGLPPYSYPHIRYACDLHKDFGWFRFTGQAGILTKMSLYLVACLYVCCSWTIYSLCV